MRIEIDMEKIRAGSLVSEVFSAALAEIDPAAPGVPKEVTLAFSYPAPVTALLTDIFRLQRMGTHVQVVIGDVQQWAATIEKEFSLNRFDVFLRENGDLYLALVVVRKDLRKVGVGTAVMKRLTAYADLMGKRIVLTPETGFGATSVKRLERFYKRFGFVKNSGRHKDFTVRETMIRVPKE